MRKQFIKVMACTLTLATAIGVVGCGQQVGPEVDESKTQIYVYAVDNGAGYKWMEHFAEEFNALPENSGYQVIARHGDTALSTMAASVAAGTTETSVYFGSQSTIVSYVENGQLVDLSDIYDMKVDGENGGTIAEKTFDYEMYKSAMRSIKKNPNGGIYSVPYMMGLNGLVFDYKLFVDKGYLDFASAKEIDEIKAEIGDKAEKSGNKLIVTEAFGNYKEGDFLLTKGKDGKYGTYDDGQKTDIDGFNSLLVKIINDGNSPFLYTTKYVKPYTEPIFYSVLAQNMGYENFKNFMALNGDIKDKNGNVEASVNESNGYTAWETSAVKNAYSAATEFYYNYIMGDIGTINGANYSRAQILNKQCNRSSGLTHKTAQTLFISGYQSDDKAETAFLAEGCWWEQEAVGTLTKQLADNTDDEPRGYGKREFRYYLYPSYSTQIDASDKSIMCCQDDGCGVLFENYPDKIKKASADVKAAYIKKCKEFIAYTLSNDALAYYTETTGNPRPFNYSLSEAQYAKLTPFAKNVWQLSHDTEHISVVYPNVMNNLSAMRSYQNLSNLATSATIDGPYYAFQYDDSKMSVSNYVSAVKDFVKSEYSSKYKKLMEYINA